MNSGITLTSPIISGAGGTTAGQYGFDATDKSILIGDGSANKVIHVADWKTWTPSWTNLTVGNATNAGYYALIGKTVIFRIKLIFGTTSSMGSSPYFALPVAAKNYGAGVNRIAEVVYRDTGTAYYAGTVYMGTGGTLGSLWIYNAGGSYVGYTDPAATTPFTWANTDEISIQGFYEAA